MYMDSLPESTTGTGIRNRIDDPFFNTGFARELNASAGRSVFQRCVSASRTRHTRRLAFELLRVQSLTSDAKNAWPNVDTKSR